MADSSDKKTKSKLVENEERILKFWNENKIFKKTLAKESPKGEFVFYDGPPFATGLPHFGHLLPSTIKDVIPRYKTMQGYHVPRRWGWDCHGLPVENLIEKELGFKGKKDIEDYGVENFNEKARQNVLRYAKEWQEIIPRIGRWVDMENDYRTMDSGYTESVWWAFQQLHKKGLVYEGFKAMHLCPHCETTLANFEVNQGYKDIADISVYVKFELVNEPNTFFLAWTTTPWTLPGNVALAVGKDVEYVKVKSEFTHKSVDGTDILKEEFYILAKSRLADAMGQRTHVVIEEMKGEKLVGKSYKPLYDYYSKDESLVNKKNGWKVYPASFVTTEDGTGIVHIAPAFGEDDMNLGKECGLPFVQHVGTNGKFKKEVTDFPHLDVKPREDHQKTDVEVIRNLAGRGLLFDKKKITHSYPHCWRCETPLLNYATSSWFVKVTQFKDKLVRSNGNTLWTPSELRDGRFGNWLSGARDWAISRSRYWGAPIPVWKSEDGKEIFVPATLKELMGRTRAKNKYIVMRHGEAANNIKNVLSSRIEGNPHPLTELGKEQVRATVSVLKEKKVDVIVYSPVRRTRETAEMVGKGLKIGSHHMISDVRLREVGFGDLEGQTVEALKPYPTLSRFTKALPHGENYNDITNRVCSAITDLEKKFTGQTILIVTHDAPAWLLISAAQNLSPEESISINSASADSKHFMKNAEPRDLNWHPLPRNRAGEVDFHRPYIDEVVVYGNKGTPMHRVPEVFDCWFESGSMPFAESCYVGKPINGFNPTGGIFTARSGFPADFIAEGLDQTRGWFYTMITLGTALFGQSPFKNVVVNGLILAEDGQKMSKSKGNYPPLMTTVDTYGADALRYFLSASPAVKAEDVRFSEKGVDEVAKKLLQRLDNVLSFYEMYAPGMEVVAHAEPDSKNVLDIWILARLNETVELVTGGLEKYELDRAARPLMDLVDDLSNWYLRRSRDRFKSDDEMDKHSALRVTRYTLLTLSKLMAPFTPFFAEYLYEKVKDADGKESVHLEVWPKQRKLIGVDSKKLIEAMVQVRKVATMGLEARAKAKLNVRQPLKSITVKGKAGLPELTNILKDELNVKEVWFSEKIETDVVLDTEISGELKEEGDMRVLVRAIQDTRKTNGLKVGEFVKLTLDSTGTAINLVEKYGTEIKKATQLSSIEVASLLVGTEVKIGEVVVKMKLDK